MSTSGASDVARLGLVSSKLNPPWTRRGLVAREALLADIEAADAPIVALVAPAGYGKTTLLGQLAERSTAATAWLSLDTFDNDPALLFQYLGAALAPLDPPAAAAWRSGRDDLNVEPGWVLRRIAAVVSAIRVPFLLALDHVEALTNPAAGDLVAAVALNLPPGARLALASRTLPPIGEARLRAQGQLTVIGPDDLAMDLDEAEALVRAAAGSDVDADDLRDLVERTEGWPVGLYLASLTGGLNDDVERSARPRPRGSDRVIVDYLRTEVTATLPASTISFLVRTSVLDRLSAPLCDAVLGAKGSHAVLRSLEQSNLLLVPLDRERTWYRCHHLLREMLQVELQNTEPELVGRLHDRAAAWFEADGQYELAIDHAMAAGDADRAGRLVATVGPRAHVARQETLGRWVAWFDDRGLLSQYPVVAVTAATVEALTGVGHRVDDLLAKVVASGATGDAPDGSPVEAWVLFLQVMLGRQGVKQMLDDARRLRPMFSPSSSFTGGAALLEGMALYLLDEPDAADAVLDDAADLSLRFGSEPSAASALALRGVIAIDRGDWRAASALSGRAIDLVREQRLDAHLQTMVAHAVAARTAARASDVPRARAALVAAARTRPLCTRGLPISALFLVQLAHGHLAVADPSGARAVLRQAREVIAGYDGYDALEQQCNALTHMLDTIKVDGVGASSLTAAELRLLPLLATHLSYREIGERLFVSRNTVKSEAVSMFRKLGVSSRGEAVEAAERWGLLSA